MAQNLELRHLCQRQNAGDRWRSSHSKQVSCAIYVPKNDRFLQSSALVSPHIFSQHQAEQNTFTKQNFVLTIKPFPAMRHPCASQTWQFSRLRGVGSGKVLFCKCVLFSLVLRKNMGGNQRRRLQKSVIFRDIDGATNLF